MVRPRQGEGGVNVSVGGTLGAYGGFGKIGEGLPVDIRDCVGIEHVAPGEGCGVCQGSAVTFSYCRLDTPVVDVQDFTVVALGELEEGVVPCEVDVEGGAAVVVFGPLVEELGAVMGLASFEEDVGYGVGGVGVVRTGLEEASARRRASSRIPDSWWAKA